jgi:hypothetical protein
MKLFSRIFRRRYLDLTRKDPDYAGIMAKNKRIRAKKCKVLNSKL